jgi:hypothetical protein
MSIVLPTWVKVGALLGVLTLILILSLGISGIAWLRQGTLNAVKPLYINAALKRIGDFPDSLLADVVNHRGDYHPIAGGRMPLVDGDYVMFDEKDRKMQFLVARMPSIDPDPDAIEIIDKLYDMPAIVPTLDARFASIVDKGQEKISGGDLHYETALLKGDQGKTYKGLIGCLTAKSKVVCIEAVVPSDANLDVKYLFDFLRKARGF